MSTQQAVSGDLNSEGCSSSPCTGAYRGTVGRGPPEGGYVPVCSVQAQHWVSGRYAPRCSSCHRTPSGRPSYGLARMLLGCRSFDVLGDHVRIGRIPVGHLLELAALHLPDLDQSAALVVGRRDLQGRHQPAQGEVGDLLEAVLHVDACDLAVRMGFERVLIASTWSAAMSTPRL